MQATMLVVLKGVGINVLFGRDHGVCHPATRLFVIIVYIIRIPGACRSIDLKTSTNHPALQVLVLLSST